MRPGDSAFHGLEQSPSRTPWLKGIIVLWGSNAEISRKYLFNLKPFKSILFKKKKKSYAYSKSSHLHSTSCLFFNKVPKFNTFKMSGFLLMEQARVKFDMVCSVCQSYSPALYPSRPGSVIVFVGPNCCLLHRHKWLEFSIWIRKCPLCSSDSIPNSNFCYKILFFAVAREL